jgi:hypothetical protein
MLTRKLFLRQMGGGCLTLVLAGCGGGGGDDDDEPEPANAAGCSNFLFSSNHGHALQIPAADLDSPTDKTYSVQGTATHDHPFTLTAANLARLKAGQAILVVTTGVAFEHTHDVSGGSCA